jgi:hypothetical protein
MLIYNFEGDVLERIEGKGAGILLKLDDFFLQP